MNKKFILIVAALLIACLCLTGCDKNEPAEQPELWDAKPSVMINGVLYGDTGKAAPYHTDERPDKGGHTDGQITSTTESHQYPTENDQSNFGTGYFYRYGEENTVEVFFEVSDKWKIFEAYEEQ